MTSMDAPVPGSFEAYQAEIRQILEAGQFFSLVSFIEEKGIEDEGLMMKLHTSYLDIGQELWLATKTPAEIAKMRRIADEEAKDLWG